MASSSLSDVLQLLGFSELIEKFEGEQFENVKDLLTDPERMKNIVPEEQLLDFTQKVNQFFGEKISDTSYDLSDSDSNDSHLNNDADSERQKENSATNNIRQKQKRSDQIFAIENVDIKQILQSTFEGRQILAWHQSKSFLNSGKRKRLVHFVIAGILNVCNRRLSPKDFEVLSHKIVEVFPKECALVYYQPRTPKNKSGIGKAQKPKGKLLHKYNNLKKIALLDEPKKSIKPIEKDIDVEPSEEIKASIEWLKNQEEPWAETQKHWKITATYRRSQIESESSNKISIIYNEWPILKCPRGYQLIGEDFSFCKFCDGSISIESFNNFFTKAFNVKPLAKDEHCDVLIGMLDSENLKEDDGILVRLMLLCIMLPSTARIPLGKRKIWKPSAVESLEGIVTRIKIHGDIEQVKHNRHQYAKSKGITVQPYIIVVEEDDYVVSSVYLCIDDILYAIPSLLEALDICFKSFHVYNARYTVQSEHIWLLLQIGLYRFRTKWDSCITSVTEILNDMGCLLPIPKN